MSRNPPALGFNQSERREVSLGRTLAEAPRFIQTPGAETGCDPFAIKDRRHSLVSCPGALRNSPRPAAARRCGVAARPAATAGHRRLESNERNSAVPGDWAVAMCRTSRNRWPPPTVGGAAIRSAIVITSARSAGPNTRAPSSIFDCSLAKARPGVRVARVA